jgi:hypothetical protein
MLEFVGVRDITVQDVLESRLIAYPLRLLGVAWSPTVAVPWLSPRPRSLVTSAKAGVDHWLRGGDQVS